MLRPILAAARKRRVAVVVVNGDAKHDPPATDMSKVLRWVSLLTKGSAPDLHCGAWVTGLPGPVARHRKREPEGSPSILLTHCGTRPAGAKGFSYYALGHLHEFRQYPFDDGAIAAHPGHLVSRWDGPGKAWPTYFIKGTLSVEGQVHVWPVPLEKRPYAAPATRQFYTEHEYAGKPQGLLVLVHAPPSSFFTRRGLGATLDWPKRKWGPRRAIFRYQSQEEMREIVRKVAAGCPKDVFVTPSPRRAVLYGRQLRDPALLQGFLEGIHKQKPGTQTSDRAGQAWADPAQRVTFQNLARGKAGKARRDGSGVQPLQSTESRRYPGSVPLCAGR